jgi:hypothetical protein
MGRLATLQDAQYRQEAIDAGVVRPRRPSDMRECAADLAPLPRGKSFHFWGALS